MSSILKVDQLQDSGGNAIITSDGSGNLTPNFNNAGTMVLLSSQTASSDNEIIFNNTLITSTYNDYKIKGSGIIPATDSAEPNIFASADNGSNFLSCDSGRQYNQLNSAAGGAESASGTSIEIGYNIGNDANLGGAFEIHFSNLNATNMYKWGYYYYVSKHDTNAYIWKGGYSINSQSAVNYIKFAFNTGAISTGKLQLYGVKT